VARILLVGATVLAIGVLVDFASRSVNGGVAGILLLSILSWIAFSVALRVVRGMWRASQRIEARHAILGGCLMAISICAIGGFLVVFGYQLLLGVFFGGLAAILNARASTVTTRELFGLEPAPTPAPDAAASGAQLRSVWAGPLGVAGAALVALVCVAAGLYFGGLGTFRALEGVSSLTDYFCTPPCAGVDGLWMQVIPQPDGRFVAMPDSATIELRMTFRNDVAGDRVPTPADFALTSAETTYQQNVGGRPECGRWRVSLHLDERTGVRALCFAVPAGASVNPEQLILTWTAPGGTAIIPLQLPPGRTG
jgi:hypothetical protein